MSMTIHTNVPATRAHGVYNRNNTYMNEAMTRVATGMKINSAKDGASVYAISERMRGQIRANDQANQNTQNDSALLKTAQGGISNTISILNTLRERAINSANDSNLNTNRSDIATEVQQLVQQIDDNANKVKFNGRTLLNGAVDNTVGKLGSVSANDNAATKMENPTATSTHAVYGLTNLYQWSSSSVAAAASNTKLVDLVKANATGAGDTLFQVGDKITFNWKENGASKSVSMDVASDTTVAQLAGTGLTLDGLSSAWKAAATELTSSDSGTYNKVVLDAQSEKFTTSAAGIYAVGKADKAITDFSVSVTYNTENGRVNRTEAQEAIALRGMQQSYGEKLGSNSVVSTEWFNGATDAGINASNTSAFQDWTVTGGTTPTPVWSEVTSVKFEVTGSAGNKTVTLDAGKTIEDLNKELADIGVQASIVGKGETVTYNGATVTRSSGGNDAALKAASSGLFFVGADGVDIGSVKITGQKAGATGIASAVKSFTEAAGATTGVTLTSVQARQTDTPQSSTTAALTFFVGGEPNFGINVSINKMTSNELLGMSADGFATKFLSKEGAQAAITTIDNALNKALNEQTKLGALEARLGYTSDNLTTMNENLEASDSVMRDSDIAKEMTNYMKYSVLSQAAQYMLAQAGQNAFSVLNLLQQ